MLSLAAQIPIWLLSLSVFHFTVTLHHFQQGFDLLTPSVIQRSLTATIKEEQLVLTIEPPIMTPAIAAFFNQQFSDYPHPYQLQVEYFTQTQSDPCLSSCHGVKVTLSLTLHFQIISFHRHYQIIRHE